MHLRIRPLRHPRECREDTDLDCGVRLRPVAIIRKRLGLEASLYQILQILSVTVTEIAHFRCTSSNGLRVGYSLFWQPTVSV